MHMSRVLLSNRVLMPIPLFTQGVTNSVKNMMSISSPYVKTDGQFHNIILNTKIGLS